MLEAFVEVLPQSIIQLIAMVFYQETNLTCVISILLSMTSIMSKMLIISRGIDWISCIFSWLCVCTDFFDIFFIVSLIFSSNNCINSLDDDKGFSGLGYFNRFSQIWCWKIICGITNTFNNGN